MSTDPREQAGSSPFWSFVALARERLTHEHGVEDVRATEVLLALNRASGTITYDLEATSHRPQGRSWAAFRLMYVLWIAGPLESRHLATVAGMSRAAVSNLTGSLERAKVLRRRPHESDGRSVILELTDEGRRETDEAFVAQHARERAWAGALTGPEQDELIRLLDKLMNSPLTPDRRERP